MATSQISQKKLKAIVFTDIADFTKLSSQDEQNALDLIQKQNEIVKPIVKKHHGEWLKEIGDGLLLSFDSSIEAVHCSIEIQQTLKEVDDLNIRIGIHQGDIFIIDKDVFGDDVNIASRVEAFSPRGGIAISDKINKDISGVSELKSKFLGHRKLKGVGQDTKIYCIVAKDLNVHRKQWLHFLSGITLMSFGILAGTLSIIGYISGYFKTLTDFAELEMEIGLTTLGKAMIRHFTFFIFGYSNYMYVNGVSSKTHKYVVYASYVAILIFVLILINAYITGEFS